MRKLRGPRWQLAHLLLLLLPRPARSKRLTSPRPSLRVAGWLRGGHESRGRDGATHHPDRPRSVRGASLSLVVIAMFRLGQVNCRRCWRPLDHCACDAPALLAHDDMALLRLQTMKARIDAGAYGGPDDQHNIEQQRAAFLLWLDDHGKLARE